MKNLSRKKKLKVILLVEHYQREYEFAALLCKSIQDAGLECTIYHIHFDFYKIILVGPFCASIIYPFYYTSKDSPTHRILRLLDNVNHFNLAWEQTNYQANSNNKVPRDKFSRNITNHFLWNKINLESYRNARASHCIDLNIPNYNYLTLGTPDAVSPKQAITMLGNKTQDSILFADNLSWIYYSEKKLKELYNTRTFAKNDIQSLVEYSRQYLLHLLLDCQASPNIKLLFRLRPNVSIRCLHRILVDLGFDEHNIPHNFKPITSLTSNQFIQTSTPIVSNNSTILLDAYYARKHCFMLNYLDLPSIFSYSWASMIPSCSSLHEVLDLSSKPISFHHTNDEFFSSPSTAISKICNIIAEKSSFKKLSLPLLFNTSIYFAKALPYSLKHMFIFARPKLKQQVLSHFSRDIIYHTYSIHSNNQPLMSILIDNT